MGMTGSVSNERLRGANRCLFVVLKHLSYLVYDSHGADKRAGMQKGREKDFSSIIDQWDQGCMSNACMGCIEQDARTGSF